MENNGKEKFWGKATQVLLIVILISISIFYLNKSPCDKTLTYSIGQVDPEFGVNKDDIEKYANDASTLWNDAESKWLLKETPANGEVTINFIFDERQRATIQAEKLKAEVYEQKNNLNDLKSNIDSLKVEYDNKKNTLDTAEANYNSKLNKHNNDVAYWNSKGGAPKNIYNQMMSQKVELDNMYNNLNTQINEIQRLITQINTLSDTHNNLASQVNDKVGTINQNAGQQFEEGVYSTKYKTMTIYEFSDENSLKRVLAHEMGHALGLLHVENKNSIMYYLNNAKTFALTNEDKDALNKICENKSVLTLISKLKLLN